ncbi:MAG: glutamate--tRNA ligase [Bacillota bacterium]|nr:glutamate--tRNA ligase [Bacillota bacterium]
MNEVRVRFAPSPTGTLHIGGARTALFNWLYARSNQGKFILRLEDTDLGRSTESSAAGIVEGLRWLGLDWDEGPDIQGPYGPYRQSERLAIYQHYIEKLLNEGKAYYCFCSSKELAARREQNLGYDGKCRDLTPAEVNNKLASGLQPVVRFKMPQTGTTTVEDQVRGSVHFENKLFDDSIICKSDGWPTYNLAVVIDDHEMKINHVIRAEEHLPNTPKQLLLYEALGFEVPNFAHVSMILAPDRSKLSKRHGATSVQEFRDNGYLPETMINYLALLGWSSGEDITFFNLTELINRFNLSNVSKSAAVYDTEKLTWMNGHYVAEAETNRLIQLIKPEAIRKGWLTVDNQSYFTNVVELVKNRVKTTNEIFDAVEYFFEDVDSYDTKGMKKHFSKPGAIDLLQSVLEILTTADSFSTSKLEEMLRAKATELNVKAGDLIHPARLALSGRTNTPGIFDVMVILGRKNCIIRTEQAIHFIQEQS